MALEVWRHGGVQQRTISMVGEVNDILTKIGRPFGFRVNQAIHAYVANYPGLETETDLGFALADTLRLRILPKLRGIELEDKTSPALRQIAEIASKLGDQELANSIREAAQGTALLTLIGADTNKFRPVEIHWERMEEVDLTEGAILDLLREKPTEVPPVVPQPSHNLLWTEALPSVGGSLVDFVPQLSAVLEQGPPTDGDDVRILKALSILLTRRGAPSNVSRPSIDMPSRSRF